jgi:hypothetical protein
MRRDITEEQQIAAGCFFTEAELNAKPHLRRLQVAASPAASDPNSRPPSREARQMVPVCAYCYQPGDERSALVQTARNDHMHPECDAARTAELAARKPGA